DGFRERHALDLHHEVEHAPALAAAEAIENILRRIDRKRRRLLLVKRTARHPVRALLLQRHIILYDAHDVRLASEIVNECLREAHGCISELAQQNLYCFNSTTVAPVPPCSGGAGAKLATCGWSRRKSAMARRSAPVPWPWMMRTRAMLCRYASSRNLST